MCAMTADCMRIAGNQDRMGFYRDEAVAAWKFAAERDLDFSHSIGNGRMRGRNLKMMAASSLYNATGDRFYEDQMAKETVAWEFRPHGQALWRARYCYANNEFTPQQTMRGKTALYGYLYSLGSRDPRDK